MMTTLTIEAYHWLRVPRNWLWVGGGILGVLVLAVIAYFGYQSTLDKMVGSVVALEDRPAHTYTTSEPTYMQLCSYDKDGTHCHNVLIGYHDVEHYVPECFWVKVEGDHSGDKCIDQGKWMSLKVGDYYVGEDVK